MKVTMEDLYAKADHVECAMCHTRAEVRKTYGIDLKSEDDLDYVYEIIDCCDDPLFDAVIISKQPLFPPDNPKSEVNQDHYHYGDEQYNYTVNEDLMDMINEQE